MYIHVYTCIYMYIHVYTCIIVLIIARCLYSAIIAVWLKVKEGMQYSHQLSKAKASLMGIYVMLLFCPVISRVEVCTTSL